MLGLIEPGTMKVARQTTETGIVTCGDVAIGSPAEMVVIAGPCAIEGEEMLRETAYHVIQAGAQVLRGGAFKPRTSPYSYQGMGLEGVKILERVGREMKIPVVTEVIDVADAETIAEYVDILQVGARNMQNYALLRKLGTMNKPVILKRGLSATIEEWLLAAEYILSAGNEQVILCERGIRTHETWTRNTLDLSAVAVAKQVSHLPVLVDPSHATGRVDLVGPMALAAVAAGADGLMVEVHPRPEEALSDGQQSLTPQQFSGLMTDVGQIARAVGRY
ncbi:MAG: 3-deoxy-7-phosphoheptulonate synthase [Chitinophagales bacterium]